MQSIWDEAGGGWRRGLTPQVKAMQAPYDQQIRAVLTPGQYSKFDQLKDSRPRLLRSPAQGRAPRPRQDEGRQQNESENQSVIARAQSHKKAPSKLGRGFFVGLDAAGFSACLIGFAHF